ncbi:hypothetical protein FJZ19_00365 [Candidatus Pacearchaeota archaeon]|nr:hypothetical protein [Candidatus Pacearchaeota archaeon]
MNEKLLEEIGLTKGEIRVYLTLLKTGETTTGKIIENSGLSSGKIYEILEKLIKKGLVSFMIKEKTKYFSAANPIRILDYMNEKEKTIEQKKRELKKELPSLIELQKAGKEKHETTLFKGFKGIQTAIFEALSYLNKNNEILAMGIRSRKEEQYNLLWQRWHKERIRKKIICKMMFSEKGEYYSYFRKMKLTQIKIIQGLTPSAIDIMGNRILIFTYGKEPSCLLISNPEIAESFKTLFYSLWKIGKK